ncbi:MAG: NUDIX hydrolase [Minwuia sp.]|uniref:NUDIX hydrolase n=1 Tax=Minwuia sp. TaxID=2493630 RepID=UPI003A866162
MSRRRPGVGLGAVIFRDDRVLMIKRGKPPRMGQWSIPGGRQEWGETAAAGAAREVLEETGIICRIGGLLDVIDGLGPAGDDGPEYHYTLIDFWGQWVSGDPVAGDDAADAVWMDAAEIEALTLWPETRRVIELARQKRDGS